jgi:hypothetical protein
MADSINYGPIDVTASTWIVPGTISEEEPYSEDVYHYEEGEVV